jgi:hypothetical protein
MRLSSPALLKQFAYLLQGELSPVLESATGPLSKHSRLSISIVSMAPLAGFTGALAKAVYKLTATRQLLDRLRSDEQLLRLCGWDSLAAIPAESTFSRAFPAFAIAGTPTHIHEAPIKSTRQHRTSDFIARDATAIEARERFPEDNDKTQAAKDGKTKKKKPVTKKTKSATKSAKTRRHSKRRFGPNRRSSGPYGPNRRAKLAERGTRIQRQHHMTLAAMLAELPRHCSLGVKKSSTGHQQYWRGYKLHWDAGSGDQVRESYNPALSARKLPPLQRVRSPRHSQEEVKLAQTAPARKPLKCRDITQFLLPAAQTLRQHRRQTRIAHPLLGGIQIIRNPPQQHPIFNTIVKRARSPPIPVPRLAH